MKKRWLCLTFIGIMLFFLTHTGFTRGHYYFNGQVNAISKEVINVSGKVFSLRDYLSVKEGRCGMQASEHSLTGTVLNKIFVWLRSVFLTATLKKDFLLLWLKIKNNFILCVRSVTIFDRFLLKLLLF